MTPRTRLCLSVARETLEKFEFHKGRLGPPVPIEELAERHGFQVVYLSSVPDEFSALVSTREKLIGINRRHHRHRQRFSICHELGHIFLKHPPEARCNSKQIALYNLEADECAAELLMPGSLVAQWLGKTRSTTRLAALFDVSVEAMKRKVAALEAEHKDRSLAEPHPPA